MKKLYKLLICFGMLIFSIIGAGNFTMAEEDGDVKGGELPAAVVTAEKTNTKKTKSEDNCSGGIKLNTNVPLIGNCISRGEDPTNEFPRFTQALIKIIMSVTLIVCFILIIVGGIMIASDNKIGKGKELIIRVAWTILLLGMSGAILKLINPNFFG